MKLLVPIAATVAGLCAAQPAAAVTFEFYEGNNCSESMIGAYNKGPRDGSSVGNVTYALRGENDEARLVKVSTSWPRDSDVAGLNLQIYDSSDSKRDDDFVIIYVVDPTKIPPQGLCIGSFERNFDRNGVFMWRQPRNGLDGKVSSLIAQCATCRTVLSPAEQAHQDQETAKRLSDEERGRRAAEERRQKEEQAARFARMRRQMLQLNNVRIGPLAPSIKINK